MNAQNANMAEIREYLQGRAESLYVEKGQFFVDTVMLLNNLLVARDMCLEKLVPIAGEKAAVEGANRGLKEALAALIRMSKGELTIDMLRAAADELHALCGGIDLFTDGD